MDDTSIGEEQSSAAATEPVRKLLVLDTSYTLEMVRERGLERPILYRDLDGFFEHVWNVHPFATLVTSDKWGPRYGAPQSYELAPGHTIIEGKVGRFSWLKWFPPLNFLLAQGDLFLRLFRLVKRERIAAIRAPSPLYTGLFGLMLARLAGIPLVIRVGANFDELRQSTGKPVEPRLFRSVWAEKKVERFVLPRADLVAGANQNNLDFALANGARPERSTLFRYGNLIDPRHFEDPATRTIDRTILKELGVEPKRFVITVGRLEETASAKHPDDVIRVLEWLLRRGAQVKAVIVGDGPLRPAVVDFARELGVEKSVVMAGSRSQEWLSQVFPQAAVHICPQAGRALSEAALAATPTVAYDIDWQSELIHSGETGFLVPYRDWKAMAEAAEILLNAPARADALGQSLRNEALKMLDPEALTRHEQQAYRKLLCEPRG